MPNLTWVPWAPSWKTGWLKPPPSPLFLSVPSGVCEELGRILQNAVRRSIMSSQGWTSPARWKEGGGGGVLKCEDLGEKPPQPRSSDITAPMERDSSQDRVISGSGWVAGYYYRCPLLYLSPGAVCHFMGEGSEFSPMLPSLTNCTFPIKKYFTCTLRSCAFCHSPEIFQPAGTTVWNHLLSCPLSPRLLPPPRFSVGTATRSSILKCKRVKIPSNQAVYVPKLSLKNKAGAQQRCQYMSAL